MTIEDTKGTVKADMLLDAIQELRAAGAEAIQVNGYGWSRAATSPTPARA